MSLSTLKLEMAIDISFCIFGWAPGGIWWVELSFSQDGLACYFKNHR